MSSERNEPSQAWSDAAEASSRDAPNEAPHSDTGVGVDTDPRHDEPPAPETVTMLGLAVQQLLGKPNDPRRVGRYVIQGVLGRGGMGTVLAAYDERLDRRLAVKLLHPEVARSHAKRLVAEAKALAKLSHPNVVQVYEVGEDQGQWFIAMELVSGQTLRKWQKQRPPWWVCIKTYLQAGAGLAAAHAAGLTHRDFKPENCILDDDGRVRVLDFGLVRETDEQVETRPPNGAKDETAGAESTEVPQTRVGVVLGTLGYIALEQLQGRPANVKSDQFSFCASLYEALYGERPFEDDTVGELASVLAVGRVRPPPRGSRVPAKLRRVLLRGLATRAEDRWPSMAALLAELQRLVVARPLRWLVGVGAVVIVGFVAGGLELARLSALRDQSLAESERAAAAAQDAAAAAQDAAIAARDAARMAAARLHLEDPTLQLAILREIEGSKAPPGWAVEAKRALHGGVAEVVRQVHTQPVQAVAWSPDGHRIASASRDGTVRIWAPDDMDDPQVLRGHMGPIKSVAWGPDGHRVASAGDDATIRVWPAAGSTEALVLRGHESGITCVAWSPDGQRIASASSDATIRVWSADGSPNPLVLRGHTKGASSVAFSPDGQRVASASDDQTVRVWSTEGTGEPLVLHGHTDSAHAVAWSPDGRRIASASHDLTVRVWNADGTDEPLVLTGHTGHVWTIAWSPDGTRLASGSVDATLRVWDASGPGTPRVLGGHGNWVLGVAWSPDGTRIASASADHSVRVWPARTADMPLVLQAPDHLWTVAWSPDGAHVAAAGDDETVRIHESDGRGDPRVLRGHTGVIWGLAFAPDGRRIASVSSDRTVRIWNTDGSGEPLVLRGHTGAVYDVRFSPDGTRLVSAAADATMRIWSSDGTGEPLILRGHAGPIYRVRFSFDGARLASSTEVDGVWIWSGDGTGKRLVPSDRSGGAAGFHDIDFSPDGRLAVSASDGAIRLWSVDGTGEPEPAIVHLRAVSPIAVSPDDALIASYTGDGKLWIQRIDGTGEPAVLDTFANSLAWSPDGTRLATSSFEGKAITVWNDVTPVTPDDPRLWARTTYCLSVDQRAQLLAMEPALARTLHERCLERVAAARRAASQGD